MAKVSIITLCYNAEKFISRTIKSIVHQTFSDYLLRSGKLIAGLNLYILSLKKYLLSFLPLPLQNNLGRL